MRGRCERVVNLGEVRVTRLVSRAAGIIRRLHLRDGAARFGPQLVADGAAWVFALPLAAWLRYEFDASQLDLLPLALVVFAAVVAQLAFGLVFSLYRGRYGFGSFEEVIGLMWATVATAATIGIPLLFVGPVIGIPRSATAIAMPLAFLLMAAVRYAMRLVLEHDRRPGADVNAALVYGAGEVGTQLARTLRSDSRSPFRVVGLLDDDARLRGAVRSGVRVLGPRADLARIAAQEDVKHLVVAIARADAALLSEIAEEAAPLGIEVLVLPPMSEILRDRARVADLRSLSIEDVIGRHPVDTDVDAVAGYVQGKRVLVTGAGGSIGSELCKQLAGWGPGELIMLDRDETGLQTVQLAVHGHGLLHTRDVVLADIRDADTIHSLFLERRPQVVFHAAALKHLPVLEQYPDEAWKTNVLGTRNVLAAAAAADVETFVNISTDKAANPTSVLGHSKRLAEQLTAGAAATGPGRYLSVRFGNVLGSRGSMVPTFAALIEAGGPLTVTHPDITRYFMSIPEACQLVVQAGAIGRPGEVLILDMGEPVRILDVAQRMIEMSGKRVEIVFTGLRQHEKLHEELIGVGERDLRPFHELITHAEVAPLDHCDLSKGRWDSHWQREPVVAGRGTAAEPITEKLALLDDMRLSSSGPR